MKYLRQIGTIFAVMAVLMTTMVIVGSAQVRNVRKVQRPVIVRPIIVRDPFWYHRHHWGFWGDPYWHDPYLRERREQYYREKAVRDARRKISKDRAKFQADGYISPKEQEKMAKNQRKYGRAVERLNKYDRNL